MQNVVWTKDYVAFTIHLDQPMQWKDEKRVSKKNQFTVEVTSPQDIKMLSRFEHLQAAYEALTSLVAQ